jgi:Domain of unknown function (DUF4167)
LINNRQQNNRRRGRGGQRPQGNSGGGGRNQDNGNRIDNRSRGNAAQMLEKYKTLARDSQQAGDRVLTEYYLQFADHYFRVLADSRARFEENQPRREGRDDDQQPQGFEGEEGFDGDDVDEFYPRTQPQQTARQQPQQRYDRDDNRGENRDRSEPRQDYQRQDSPRQDLDRQPREDNRPRRDYGDQSRSNGNGAAREDNNESRRDARPPRESSYRDEPRRAREPREPRAPRTPRNEPEQSTLSIDILPPAIAASPVETAADVPAPKRRGRPKKAESEAAAE